MSGVVSKTGEYPLLSFKKMRINIQRPVRSFLNERRRHVREEEKTKERDRSTWTSIESEPLLKIYLAKKDDSGGWQTLFSLRTIPETLDGEEDLMAGEYAAILKEGSKIKAFLKKYRIQAKSDLEFVPKPVFAGD